MTAYMDQVNDTMTKVQMRLLREKLDEERRGVGSRLSTSSVASHSSVDERNVRLQQALLRRQALLDQLKRENYLKDASRRRPVSHAGKNRTPSPITPPPARRSVPPDMSNTRHVIEFKPARLDPLPAPPPPQQTHYITTPPQPYVIHSGATQQQGPSSIKADFMEMMMMQNAQMHQMVMQQMMLSALPKNNSLPPMPPRSETPYIPDNSTSKGNSKKFELTKSSS